MRIKHLLWGTVICAILTVAALLGWRQIRNSSTVFGPIELEQNDWPIALVSLTEKYDCLSKNEIYISKLGGYIDEQFAWKISVSPNNLNGVLDELGVNEVISGEFSVTPFWDLKDIAWWPKRDRHFIFYKSPGFFFTTRGKDGEHFFVGYLEESNSLYVIHKSQPF